MADIDTNELLIAGGAITRELAERAAQLPAGASTSRVGRLIAAGADPKLVMEALSKATNIPVAPHELVEWPTPVLMLPSTAKQLRDILACPVQRDAKGTLHVLIADPETQRALDKLLIEFKVYLAPERTVRALLQTLYAMGSAEPEEPIEIDMEQSRRNLREPPPEAIEIDLEASQRMAVAKMPGPNDPFAPKPSGSFKRPQDNEPTMRVMRAPKAPLPPLPPPIVQAPMSVVDDQTLDQTIGRPSRTAMKAALRGAFVNGVLVGVTVTAILAAIAIAVLLNK